MRLRQASGQFFSGDASMSCASLGTNFTNGRAIYAIDLEKTGNMALLFGISTRGGETLTAVFRNVGNQENSEIGVRLISNIFPQFLLHLLI